MQTFIYLVIVLMVSVFASDASHAQVLYGAATGQTSGNAPSSLYTIDPETGAANLIGPIGFNGVTGLEILPDGRLVGSANADTEDGNAAVLIEIDSDTGAGSLIGILGNSSNPGECSRMPDIAFSCDLGLLYGYSDSCSGNTEGLHLINPDNGVATLIGPSGFTDGGNGLAVRPGTSTIFGTPIDATGLVILNRITGAGTVIPPSVGNVPNAINAMDFNPETGVLFGSFKDSGDILGNGEDLGYLVTINIPDGNITVIGQTVLGLDAIVFFEEFEECGFVGSIPTLSEWGLIAMAGLLGVICLLAIRRRKAAA
ncbi:MAG TPA: IPTL-CTERM sorting domain-containing protein [Thermodesulfobacteriota bacterium]|nr:IPTL-CTERM sorting domain-containing protein [Thermodesulfobacteriota bacterium]